MLGDNENFAIIDTEEKFSTAWKKIRNYAAMIVVLACIDKNGKREMYGMWTAEKISIESRNFR